MYLTEVSYNHNSRCSMGRQLLQATAYCPRHLDLQTIVFSVISFHDVCLSVCPNETTREPLNEIHKIRY
jgi:hypothetical protein